MPDKENDPMHTPQAFPTPKKHFDGIESDEPPLEPDDVSPLPGGVLAVLTIGMGIVACLWALIGHVLEGDQFPNRVLAMFGAGACFIASGLLMRTRSILFPLIAAILGILLGIASRTMF